MLMRRGWQRPKKILDGLDYAYGHWILKGRLSIVDRRGVLIINLLFSLSLLSILYNNISRALSLAPLLDRSPTVVQTKDRRSSETRYGLRQLTALFRPPPLMIIYVSTIPITLDLEIN